METKKRLTKRQIQANDTRNRVYKTALELMETKGLNNTSIEEISMKAGVSVGTFYNYFKSKDDILVDIYRNPSLLLLHWAMALGMVRVLLCAWQGWPLCE